MNKMMDTTSMN